MPTAAANCIKCDLYKKAVQIGLYPLDASRHNTPRFGRGQWRRRMPTRAAWQFALVKEDLFQQGVPTVKALFASAALAVLLSVGSSLPVRAQQPATPNYAWAYANAQKYKIAVVDITYV